MKNQLLFNRPVPNGWKILTVDEIKSEESKSCVAGPFGSNISSKYFVESGVPVIRGSNLKKDLTRFVSKDFVFVTQDKAKEFKAQLVKPDDLVFTCWGTLGQVGLIPHDGPYPEYIISNKQLKLRANKSITLPLFLFYYFANRIMVRHINSIAIGAAVPGINLGILKKLKVCLPPLPVQHRIASILSNYDDLIENNTRRIAILEEMARNIYTEWFVNFRFPGHEKVKMVDSELGRIPSGWEVSTVEETFDILGGGTPSKKKNGYWSEGTINWYSPTDLTKSGNIFMEESLNKINELGLKKSSAKLFPAYSVMMTSRATLGVVAINTTDATTNQGFITCMPNENFPLNFLYYWIKANTEIFISKATGTTFKEITKGVFKKLKVAVPTQAVVERFDQTVSPIMKQILALQRKNNNLRQTRDLLLPRLISGDIDVSKMEVAA